MKISLRDLRIWVVTSIAFLTAAFVMLHLMGYFPGMKPAVPVAFLLEGELKDAKIACIDAVHEIGGQPGTPERDRQLKGAIEISAKLTAIDLELKRLVKSGASQDQIRKTMKPLLVDLQSIVVRVAGNGTFFEAMLFEITELIQLTEKS